MPNFVVGDRVRKPNGKRTAIVEVVQGNSYGYIRYEHNNMREYLSGYDMNRLVKIEDEIEMNVLYQDKEGKIYSKLMEKSNKQWVVEQKSSGNVSIVDPKTLEEILPYTIEVNINGKVGHYQADEDTYKVDDMFIMGKTLQLARVTKLDTKNKSAKETFKPFAKLSIETDF